MPSLDCHPELVMSTVTHDLHVDGDPECEHDFSQWKHYTDVQDVTAQEDDVLLAVVRIESDCAYCPARVGRVILNRFKGPNL